MNYLTLRDLAKVRGRLEVRLVARGSAQHRRVDARPSELPEAGAGEEKIHARSVTLSSERLKGIAKLDLVEAGGSAATPVDYKHGAPREGKDGIEMRPADRVQIALQAIVLRENGYECAEAVVFYQKTRQRGAGTGGFGAGCRPGTSPRMAISRRRSSIPRSAPALAEHDLPAR